MKGPERLRTAITKKVVVLEISHLKRRVWRRSRELGLRSKDVADAMHISRPRLSLVISAESFDEDIFRRLSEALNMRQEDWFTPIEGLNRPYKKHLAYHEIKAKVTRARLGRPPKKK